MKSDEPKTKEVPQRVLMVMTNSEGNDPNHKTGVWYDEYAEAYFLFIQNKIKVTSASPKGGVVPIDPKSAPKNLGDIKVKEATTVLKHTIALDKVDFSVYDAVFFPGGHGTMYDLPEKHVGAVVGKFLDDGKIVGTVCHGAAALVQAEHRDGSAIVKGKKITGFTNSEEKESGHTVPFSLQDKLTALGAKFEVKPNFTEHVVVDGTLVTGQNPQSTKATAKAVIELIKARK